MRVKATIYWGLCVLAGGLLAVPPTSAFEGAPLWETAPEVNGDGWRALGPFLQDLPTPGGPLREAAVVRPIFTAFQGEPDDYQSRGWEVLWPLAFGRRQSDGAYQWVTPFLHSRVDYRDAASRERWWLLPVWFSGRDSGGQPYWAVFPIGGTIGDWMGYDHVTFWLFPLYVATDKNGVTSTCWLWPIFGQAQGGDQVDKRRVFPFYGRSQDARQKQTYVLWPFWNQVEQLPSPRTGRRGDGWLLFPVCGSQHQYDQEGQETGHSWTVLWPFFSGGESETMSYSRCPWPFYRTATEDSRFGKETALHVWPFYGVTKAASRETHYAAWPLVHWWRVPEGHRERQYTGVMPLFWQETVRENGQSVAWHHQVWPLWRFEHEPEAARLRVLALWPASGPAVIYRTWAPLWTLYSWDFRAGTAYHDLLWGMAQYHHDAERTRKCALFPFFNYRAATDGYEWQLLTGLVGWGWQSGQATGRALWFIHWGGPVTPAATKPP